jgi:hypothetical protein
VQREGRGAGGSAGEDVRASEGAACNREDTSHTSSRVDGRLE